MLTVVAGAMLMAAATLDARSRLIPNSLSLVLAAFGLIRLGIDGGVTAGLAVCVSLLCIGVFAFAYGAMGGGDAKLLGAVGLWISPAALYDFFTVMALTGAVLALVVLVRRRLVAVVTGEAIAAPASVPYGAAIAAGAGYVLFAPV